MSNITIIPYMRAAEVLFTSFNMKPDRVAHFFFDDVSVDAVVQKGSTLTSASNVAINAFATNEGLYCANTRAYATVITTNPGNTLYLNENYLSLNVGFFGANVSFAATDFEKNDIVFTSPANSFEPNAATFTARVEYFNPTDRVLVVKPLVGSINTTSGNNTIVNTSKRTSANISEVVVNSRFPSGATVTSTANISKSFVVATNGYSPAHGYVPTINADPTILETITTVPSNAAGNLVFITSGSGLNQTRLVNSVSGNRITMNAAVTGLSGNTTYSFGNKVVDSFGTIAGIFQLPETENFKFFTGERIFTIVDTTERTNPDATMRSIARYVAQGLMNLMVEKPPAPVLPEPPAPLPPTVPRRQVRRDPVAQTFFTPKPTTDKPDNGVFVSSVDIFFRNKPSIANSEPQIPVSVKIVTTQNGYPTQVALGESVVACADVKVTDGIVTFPSVDNANTRTRFTFPNPVYLEPDGEYAIVVESDSPTYEVWVSELGQRIVGDANNRRVSEQPYAGSFFRSQNASTWTAYQNEDLMFVINKAVFSQTETTLTFDVIPPASNVLVSSMRVSTSDLVLANTNLEYLYRTTLASSLQQDPAFSPIVKNVYFNFSDDLRNSSKENKRERIVLAGNTNSALIQVKMSTNDPDITPMFNSERFALLTKNYLINDGGIESNNITIVSGGNHINAANIVVTISAPQLYLDDPTAQATANVVASGLSGNNVVAINIINPGRGYVESPTITITEAGAPANATAVVTSEDSKFGGNAKARYITKKVALADGFDAGDLRVYLDAIRPQGTHLVAYYKVLSDSDSDAFEDKKWKRMYLETDLTSPDTITPVELTFRANETGGSLSYIENDVTYPLGGKFKYFAVKIVMLSLDPSVPPIVRNLRAIALPSG